MRDNPLLTELAKPISATVASFFGRALSATVAAALLAMGITTIAIFTVRAPAQAAATCLGSSSESSNGPDEKMSRGRALARAQEWVRAGWTYSQSCRVPEASNSGGNYRTDCSGLVSMVWGLNRSYSTDQFRDLIAPVYEISRDELRPGDAVVKTGHMELFARWKNTADHNQGAYVYSFNTNGQTVQNPYADNNYGDLGYNSGTEMATYQAIRYKGITEDEGAWATAFNADGTLEVFARGSDGNHSLNLWQWKFGAESTTQYLGGSITGNPATAVSPNGDLQVLARSMDGSLRQWAKGGANGSWPVQNSNLGGGSIVGDPAATYYGSNNSLQIFALGANGHLLHWSWTIAGAWSYEDLGGSIVGSPAAITDGTNTLRILAVGSDGQLRLWSNKPGSGWTDQNAVVPNSSGLIGDVALTISRDRAMQVLARGTDGTLRHFAMLDNAWPVTNENLGGSISGNPAATTSEDSTIKVVVRGVDGHLRYWSFAWGSGWTKNVDKGGSIAGDVAVTNSPQGNLQIYGYGTDNVLRQWAYDYAGGTGWHDNEMLSLGVTAS
ncbi:WD40 repeat domain-containing protein [Sphaerisporangium sp. NBC_01403]|uniref:hypothetical protein n=1 Tax=Sphaerisporangium sp. NBC_01403 TaxID=2903599 RepID=UPI00325046A4